MSAAGRSAVEMLKKHRVTLNKSEKAKVAIETRVAEINKDIKEAKGPSRNDLMIEARARGIKYFRILSKKSLQIVLADGVHPDKIKAIQDEAVYAWKAGWGSKKKETENVPA